MLGRAILIFSCLIEFTSVRAAAGRVKRDAVVEPSCLLPPIRLKLKVGCGFRCDSYPFKAKLGEHVGDDFAASAGTPVYASEAGTVTWAGPDPDDANIVAVRTRRGWVYRLLHLRSYAVARGDKVFRGQFLGRSGGAVGKPGSGKYTTGAHLHFDLTIDKAFVDPMPYLCPSTP